MLRIATWWHPDPVYRWPPDLLSSLTGARWSALPHLASAGEIGPWPRPTFYGGVHPNIAQRYTNNGWLIMVHIDQYIMVNWCLIIMVDHFRETIHDQWYAWTARDPPFDTRFLVRIKTIHQRYSPVHLSFCLVTHINNRSWRYESFVARLFICTIRGMRTSQQFA